MSRTAATEQRRNLPLFTAHQPIRQILLTYPHIFFNYFLTFFLPNSGLKYSPVYDFAFPAISSGVPVPITAAPVPAFRAQINDMVRGFYLHPDYAQSPAPYPRLHQSLQHLQQFVGIGEMQTGSRFVQDIEGFSVGTAR